MYSHGHTDPNLKNIVVNDCHNAEYCNNALIRSIVIAQGAAVRYFAQSFCLKYLAVVCLRLYSVRMQNLFINWDQLILCLGLEGTHS